MVDRKDSIRAYIDGGTGKCSHVFLLVLVMLIHFLRWIAVSVENFVQFAGTG